MIVRTRSMAAVGIAWAVALGLSGATAVAQIPLGATLTGDQEAPVPVVTAATGTATMTYDDVANTFDLEVTVTGLPLAELNPNPGQFHIHGPAAPGVAAGVIVNLGTQASFMDIGGGQIQYVANGLSFPQANEADLLNGLTYLNLHSMDHPGGEIRGQLIVIPEPASLALLTMCGAACVRRRG